MKKKDESAKSRATSSYFVPTTSKTLDILECFRTHTEELTLEEIVSLTKIPRTTTYRILYTLEQRRYVTRRGKRYHANPVRKKIQASLGIHNAGRATHSFISAATRAAAMAGIDLRVFENGAGKQTAVNNVEEMIRAKTDVAVQYRLDSADAPIIGDLFHTAQIPWISVDALHPGAVYLGVDNYKCGYASGTALGAFAKEHWKGRVEKIVFLESAERGAVAQSRSAGFSKAIEAELKQEFLRLPGGEDKTLARLSLSSHLKKQSTLKRLLVCSHGENGALGAIDALHEFELDAAVVGMDGGADVVRFLAGSNGPYIAFIVLSVERYGAALADLVLRLINNEQVAPFCYVEYELIDQAKARAIVASSDLRSRRSRYVL